MMFCGHCGSELQATDKFCGVCGETNTEAAASAPVHQAPAKKRPAPPPTTPSSPQAHPSHQQQNSMPAPRPQKTQLPPVRPDTSTQKKKSLPDLPDSLPLKDKKKRSPVLLLVLLLVLIGAVAASYIMLKKQGPQKINAPIVGKPNIKSFAATLCGLTKTNPVAIDDSYNYEFHAIMSSNDVVLKEKGYTLNEYIDFAVDDIKNQMGQQTYEKVESCSVKLVEEKPCQQVYNDLSGALSRHGVNYSIEAIQKAGSMQKLSTCGIIILEESWAGSDGRFPIAYFVGATGPKLKILNYFYSDYFSAK